MSKQVEKDEFAGFDLFEDVELIEREHELVTPNGEKTGIFWQFMSTDDPRLLRHQRAARDKRLEKQRKNKFISAEDEEKTVMELISKTVTGWRWGDRKYKGETPVFSDHKVLEIITEPRNRWIFEQINDFLGDAAAFFQTKRND